jgi:hypothetical protein
MVRVCTLGVCVAAMAWIVGCSQEPPAAAPELGTAPPASPSAPQPVEAPRLRDRDRSESPAVAASPAPQQPAPTASETPSIAGNLKPSAGVQGHKSVLSALGRSLLKGLGGPSTPPQMPPEGPRFNPEKP